MYTNIRASGPEYRELFESSLERVAEEYHVSFESQALWQKQQIALSALWLQSADAVG